ncbi:MAG: ribbon-helix-helix domain-containing protein [Spirochaetales bacterium]|nr:ribbon-helix-helix domain-containing protein [Spirochaetales bacterium]
MTTVRLNDNIDKKLSILTDFEKTTKTEIIKKAINEYYAAHIQEKTPYELGENLFGRHGDDSDLSTSYKNKLKGFLNEKHSH